MATQHETVRADGSVLFRFTAGALAFDVLSSPAQLEHCCAFLKDAATATQESIPMGLFGPCAVLLIRGTDDWSVRVHVTTASGDGDPQGGQCISADIRRVVLLKALTQFLSPQAAAEVRTIPVPEPAAVRAAVVQEAHDRRVVHTAADMRGLIVHAATHWTVPRIDVAIDALPELERQRAQTRITRLAGVSEYQSLGAWAVVVTLVAGTIWIFYSFNGRTMEQRWIDTYVSSWGLWEYALGLVIAAGCAWIGGKWLGALWCRGRLLLALCRLWQRVRALEDLAAGRSPK